MLTPKLFALTVLLTLQGCGDGGHGHSHGDGSDHSHPHGDDDAGAAEGQGEAMDDDHVEVPLASVQAGDLELSLAQGHGGVEAGKESHLVIKLPYSDGGETQVRAWLGMEDRTQSLVGKGDYSATHDDYDVHAIAPDPLPEGVRWWIELERPGAEPLVVSAEPILE